MEYLHQGVNYSSMDDLLEALIEDIIEHDIDTNEEV